MDHKTASQQINISELSGLNLSLGRVKRGKDYGRKYL
jgi:hypothetical protein